MAFPTAWKPLAQAPCHRTPRIRDAAGSPGDCAEGSVADRL